MSTDTEQPETPFEGPAGQPSLESDSNFIKEIGTEEEQEKTKKIIEMGNAG